MGNKECNKCKKKGLGWDMEYNKKTGKWKLDDHRRQDGKWCNKLSVKSQETKPKAGDIEKCKLCDGNSGWLLTRQGRDRNPNWVSATQEEHAMLYHPNNEVMDDIDTMVITDDEKHNIREYRKSLYGDKNE